jgi:hypothetical protein
MNQINDLSLRPMTDLLAIQTIDSHKHLLESVVNKTALCFFAATNRN